MPRVAIDVLLKHEILDPQGRAVEAALGHEGVADVRVGKHLELDVDGSDEQVAATVEQLCADFLTNPVIESYTWRTITAEQRADAPRG